ncbi:MAG: chemotaxis protein CheW [Thermodesulfobacteriota bacterium]
MDKVFGDDDIKGLEEEIDSAVDRLFVEKKAGPTPTVTKPPQPPVKEPSFRMEKDFDFEAAPSAPPPPPPPASPALRFLEKMEGQLLSLEWEINKENLMKTKEEVLALRQTLKERPEVGSVLTLMDKVLDYMVKNEEKIRPPLIKFLMDSKETLKLLMRKEGENELKIYRELAYLGIQARYSCLEELKEAKLERPAPSLREEIEKAGILIKMENQMRELMNQTALFFEKMEGLYQKLDLVLERVDQGLRQPLEPFKAIRSVPMDITVFKVEERLLGVDSGKIYKLFKVPEDHRDRYADQQKIRVKGLEMRLIDLRKIFSIPWGSRKGAIKILTVNENGEYKGFLVDQVLERLSTQMETGGNYGEYFTGIARWTYQARPTEISILDLKKF